MEKVIFRITTSYGKSYVVNAKGELAQGTFENHSPFSGQWLFLGIIKVNAIRTGFISFERLRNGEKPIEMLYKNRNPRFTIVDSDHGTTRIHGSTKCHGIESIYVNS